MRIRLFRTEDYADIVAMSNANFPEYPGTVEEMQHRDERRDPKVVFQRYVAEQDGRVVGVGRFCQREGSFHPGKFWMDMEVHPEHQRQGIGSALLAHLLACLDEFEPRELRCGAREDMAHSVSFLQKREFAEEDRAWESRLDVGAFDFGPYQGVEEQVRSGGIDITTMAELESAPDFRHNLYELYWQLDQDVPSPVPPTKVPFEEWERQYYASPNLMPDAHFIAVDGDELVGLAVLWSAAAEQSLYNGLTGVLRSHRRRGIALALKLRTIAYAREQGRPEIKTWNDTRNRPMLSINERLGFSKQPAWIGFKREFGKVA